ncbi:MAG: hypothetical protein ACXW04_11685 [Methylobacter sp.]
MSSRIYMLIKVFDKEEHADAFIQKGDMFCRTLGDFKKIEDDDVRGDSYEGVTDWHQPDQITLTISYKDNDGVEHSFPVEGLAGPVVMQNNGYDRLNLYCMYAVKVPEFEESYETEDERVRVVEKINAMLKERSTLSEEVLSLGEFSVVVYQVEDFINRVKQAAKSQSLACWNRVIKYYDPDTFHGNFKELEAVFRKRNIYAHQNEYRFAFGSHEPEGVKTISVGPLDGIAFKVPTKEINHKVQIRLVE